ncbi:MAG TPA: shikimate dehydrogenase [Cellulomonadaceae bacterium]|nr:shikimate dehydrogenase [Cellulomonadaceae bacterium]
MAEDEGLSGGRRAAVLGHPIAHSLSPALHLAAYRALGLVDWQYGRQDVQESELAEVIASLDHHWAGLSLTMPLKHAVIPMLDHVEPLAEVVGAVNTVLVQGRPVRPGDAARKGRPVLVGANTDVHGIVAALQEAVGAAGRPLPVRPRAVVLGAGATAASAFAALGQLGCTTPTVHLRSLGRSGALIRAAHRMGVEPTYLPLDDAAESMLEADIVISTLPAHGADPIAARLASHVATSLGALLDVVYEPRPTALSVAWAHGGGAVVGGERMLLHQAAEQVRLMTGRPAPLAAMDAALEAALAGHGTHPDKRSAR